MRNSARYMLIWLGRQVRRIGGLLQGAAKLLGGYSLLLFEYLGEGELVLIAHRAGYIGYTKFCVKLKEVAGFVYTVFCKKLLRRYLDSLFKERGKITAV